MFKGVLPLFVVWKLMANCTNPVKSWQLEAEVFEENDPANRSGDKAHSRSWRKIASLVACEEDPCRAFELTKELFRTLDVEITNREAEEQNTYNTVQR